MLEYDRIEVMLSKELMLANPMVRLSVLFAIATVKGNNCRIHFLYMRKNEDINLLRNADLAENNGTL